MPRCDDRVRSRFGNRCQPVREPRGRVPRRRPRGRARPAKRPAGGDGARRRAPPGEGLQKCRAAPRRAAEPAASVCPSRALPLSPNARQSNPPVTTRRTIYHNTDRGPAKPFPVAACIESVELAGDEKRSSNPNPGKSGSIVIRMATHNFSRAMSALRASPKPRAPSRGRSILVWRRQSLDRKPTAR